MSKFVSRETSILILICIVDTFSTAVLWMTGMIREANPIMAWALSLGIEVFYVIRFGVVFTLAGLVESYKRFNPVFVKRAMQATTAAYIGIYLLSVIHANG